MVWSPLLVCEVSWLKLMGSGVDSKSGQEGTAGNLSLPEAFPSCPACSPLKHHRPL